MTPAISIYTFTLGRPCYLLRQLRSVVESARGFEGEIEHHVCYQGVPADPEVTALAADPGVPKLRLYVHCWPENLGIAGGINRIVPELRGELLIKMDDDCTLESRDFFRHVVAIAALKPGAVFSPYPVGLLRRDGSSPAISRQVEYSAATDTFYTFRRVEHVGGLCRIAPAALVRDWTLEENRSASGTEDRQHSARCLAAGIEMYYLENAIIVEHQETALGQRARLSGYFERNARAGFARESLYQRALTRFEGRLVQWIMRMRDLSR